MRRLFLALLVLVAAVAVAVVARRDSGYVMIHAYGWTLELSFILACALLLAGFLVVYAVLRLLIGGYHAPRAVRRWRRRRAERRALAELEQGWSDLLLGDWQRAQRRLEAATRHREGLLLACIGAARAAHELGQDERRDEWLRRAAVAEPKAEIGVALAKAGMQVDHAQFAQAAANLDRLRDMAPGSAMVVRQRMRLFVQLGDWERLLALVPEVRRHHLLNDAEARDLELRAADGLLDDPAMGNEEHLSALWDRLPASLRDQTTLLRRYVQRLLDCGAGARAERVLRDALDTHWDPSLVYLYGLVEATDSSRQLRQAERWRERHGDDPILLLTLGRLCRREALWGKARDYLQAGVRAGARVETYGELAQVLEKMDEPGEALRWYRRAAKATAPEARRIAWRDEKPWQLPAPETVRKT
ncbi:MAG: heme biosynthesis HemY N-terminal domain-containing protein [Gammaproteobacteria bacterium]|jgi:HemY protein|nr:heme biosynthesis HemY N-terminal domain-containing protein [Gammaproteobacteria bacterium]